MITRLSRRMISRALVSLIIWIPTCADRLEGRKVAKPAAPPAGTAEAKAAGSATLWDGDWLESISRRPVLLYPRQFFYPKLAFVC